MKEKTLNTVKYKEICDTLPECLQNYCYNGLTGKRPLTRISYVRDIQEFLSFSILNFPYFPEKEIKEITVSDLAMITANDINTYLSVLQEAGGKEKNGLKETTLARKRSSLSTVFAYLVNTERKLDYNPVGGAVKIRLPEKNYVVYLTEDEQKTLLDGIYAGTGLTERELKLHKSFQKRDSAIIFLFLDMGLRVSELHGIDIKDLDLEECSVIVARKGHKISKMWYSDLAKELLQEYLEERKHLGEDLTGDTPLFVTHNGSRLAVRSIQAMLEKYMNACLPQKAEKISVHKLRSSFAMSFYKASDGDILALQQRLGHSSIRTTNVYAKASANEMKDNRNWH